LRPRDVKRGIQKTFQRKRGEKCVGEGGPKRGDRWVKESNVPKQEGTKLEARVKEKD